MLHEGHSIEKLLIEKAAVSLFEGKTNPSTSTTVLDLKLSKAEGPMAVVFQCGSTVLDHAAADVACLGQFHHFFEK